RLALGQPAGFLGLARGFLALILLGLRDQIVELAQAQLILIEQRPALDRCEGHGVTAAAQAGHSRRGQAGASACAGPTAPAGPRGRLTPPSLPSPCPARPASARSPRGRRRAVGSTCAAPAPSRPCRSRHPIPCAASRAPSRARPACTAVA